MLGHAAAKIYRRPTSQWQGLFRVEQPRAFKPIRVHAGIRRS